jgi:hypothetical protein
MSTDIDLINTRLGELNNLTEHHAERIAALEDEIAELRQLLSRTIAGKPQTILAARTVSVSPEMSATGRSDIPQAADVQTALINSRTNLRKPNVPGPVKFGSRP